MRDRQEVHWRDETTVAIETVRSALGILQDRSGAESVRHKVGRDIVTGTDLASEDRIRTELQSRFPAYPVVGEERGGEVPAGGAAYWLVDPLCGTRNFASRIQVYCTNLALVEHGQVTAAVAGDGATGDIYVAERGMGAFLISGADVTALRASEECLTIAVDEASASQALRRVTGNFVRDLLLRDRWHLRMLGSTLTLAQVARGSLAASLIFAPPSPVHVAAGSLIAAEAGALVTDLAGRVWDVNASSLIAVATPELHRDLIAMLGGAFPSPAN